MRKNILAASLLIPFILGFAACDTPPSSTSTTGSTVSQGTTQSGGNGPAVSSAAWPPADPKDPTGKNVIIAENALAENYYLVVDFSGSMRDSACNSNETKEMVVKRVVPKFVNSLPPQANLGLMIFDRNGASERIPLGSGPENRRAVIAAIANANANGGTPLSTAIDIAYRSLIAQARKQMGYGKYRIVVITDGDYNMGYSPRDVIEDVFRNSPAVVDTIGFCIGTNHSLNQSGKTIYREASSPEALELGLKAVLVEAPVFDAKEFTKE